MPKIDWADDDQPRWEPRYRPRRNRQPWLPGRPSADRLPVRLILSPELVEGSKDERDALPARRPLHLIWGEPHRSAQD